MRSALLLTAALVCLNSARAFAQDEDPPDEQPAAPASVTAPTPIGGSLLPSHNKKKLDKDTKPNQAPSSAEMQAAGLGDIKKYHFKIFEGIPDAMPSMPDRPGGGKGRLHGSLGFLDPYDAYAVAFHVMTEKASGLCQTGDEGQVTPTDGTCNYKMWISKTPGGPPAHMRTMKDRTGKAQGLKCVASASYTGGMITYRAAKSEIPNENVCDGLAPGKYYCNFISLWEKRTPHCGLVLGAPIVQAP